MTRSTSDYKVDFVIKITLHIIILSLSSISQQLAHIRHHDFILETDVKLLLHVFSLALLVAVVLYVPQILTLQKP